MPAEITSWNRYVTCILCATRAVVHKRLESWESMKALIDLDNPEVAKKFHFTGKRFRFRWLISGRLVYVYNSEQSISPMMAIHIDPDEPSLYEHAQAAARNWIVNHGDGHAEPNTHERTRRQAIIKIAPRVPAGYTGPLCPGCKKPDEGDFVDHGEQKVCVTCLIGGKV